MLSYELLVPMADAYSKDATSLVGIIKHMKAGLEKAQLIQAYADSIKTMWIVMCAPVVWLVSPVASLRSTVWIKSWWLHKDLHLARRAVMRSSMSLQKRSERVKMVGRVREET